MRNSNSKQELYKQQTATQKSLWIQACSANETIIEKTEANDEQKRNAT